MKDAEARAAYNQIRPILQEMAQRYGFELVEWYHDIPYWLLQVSAVETFYIGIMFESEWDAEDGSYGTASKFEIRGTVLENGAWRTVCGPESISVKKIFKRGGPYSVEVKVPQREFRATLERVIVQTTAYVKEMRV